jgi:hypothetical protein
MIDLVFWGSCVAALGLSAVWAGRRRNVRPFLWTVLALGALVGLLIANGVVVPPGAEQPTARGAGEVQWALVVALYGEMILGMLAHAAYHRFQRPRGRRRKFDLGAFLAPVFVSPIIFLPLASILQATEPVQADATRLMLFLVAFENGFFWREFFENRMTAHAERAAG